jgi:enterochelin esterase-like enzyme
MRPFVKNCLVAASAAALTGWLAAGLGAQEPEGVRAASNVRPAQYPRVLPDRRVQFRLRAPEAVKVQLDLNGRHDMVKDTSGTWSYTTAPLGPGFHYYSLIIDGVAVADPASESFYGMGRMASGLEIPYDTDAFAVKDVPHGEIRMRRYYSAGTGSWRRFFLYTPPGYDRNPQLRYPVLYILHGGGEDERGWATQGLADVILDNLIAAGQARPMLVAMLDGNAVTPGFGADFLEKFQAELFETIIPFVERYYRVQADPQARALAGLSMGGLQTLHVGLQNPDMFAYLGVFSSGYILPRQAELAEQAYARIAAHPGELNSRL